MSDNEPRFTRSQLHLMNYFRPITKKLLAQLFVCGAILICGQISAHAQDAPQPDKQQVADAKGNKVTVTLQLEGAVENPKRTPADNGALIRLNDDFDEGNRAAAPGAGKLGDNENDAIAGDRIVGNDNELRIAKVKFEATAPEGDNKKAKVDPNAPVLKGKWKLTFPSSIKVWRVVTVTGGTPSTTYQKVESGVASTTEETLPFNLELKVEGVAISTGAQIMTDSIQADFNLNDDGGSGSKQVFFTVFKLNLSANVGEVDEETPGAPVMLNDDNDDGDVYPDNVTPPVGQYRYDYRPFEPVLDMDEVKTVAGENDLMPVTIDIQPRALSALTGNLVLKAPGAETDGSLCLWNQSTKGDTPIAMTSAGQNYVINTLPAGGKTIYVEGIKILSTYMTLTYSHNNVDYDDVLKIDVVSLQIRQDYILKDGNNLGKLQKVIYDYASDIEFNVRGGSDNYTNKWDLNGNGNYAEVNELYENPTFQPNITAKRTAQYSYVDSASQIELLINAANNRKVYSVSVKLEPSGLVLSRTVRVALILSEGTTMPDQSNAGIQSLYAWTSTFPVEFDNATPNEQYNYETKSPLVTQLVNSHRIQYATGHNNGTYAITHPGIPASPEDLKNHFVSVDDSLWTQGWHREDLDSAVLHEREHLLIGDTVKAKIENNVDQNINTEWRKLYKAFDVPRALNFEEAYCYVERNLKHATIEWKFLNSTTLTVQGGDLLTGFRTYYVNARTAYEGLPVGDQREIARTRLQQIYKAIPFEEMKRRDYTLRTGVRPPA